MIFYYLLPAFLLGINFLFALKITNFLEKSEWFLAISLYLCAEISVMMASKRDITKTSGYREAMNDVKKGRVYQAESADDMFKQILGDYPSKKCGNYSEISCGMAI